MTVRPLISCLESSELSNLCGQESEPVFQIPLLCGLYLDADYNSPQVIDYLEFSVLRTPCNLSNHVRRISLSIIREDAEKLFGAVLDLLIVLGENGHQLKRRMLSVSRELLGEDRFLKLLDLAGAGGCLTSWLPMSAPASLLGSGTIGKSGLVRLEADTVAAEAEQDPLQLVYEYLEYSQIDQARLVLEDAVQANPARLELFEPLLEIYRSSQDAEAFQTLTEKLRKREVPLPEFWRFDAESFCGGGKP